MISAGIITVLVAADAAVWGFIWYVHRRQQEAVELAELEAWLAQLRQLREEKGDLST